MCHFKDRHSSCFLQFIVIVIQAPNVRNKIMVDTIYFLFAKYCGLFREKKVFVTNSNRLQKIFYCDLIIRLHVRNHTFQLHSFTSIQLPARWFSIYN